ncbi:MAG TPA: metallophosphoesterase [Ignavibacteriales bacterium]|nr:metallophosphoesterase [Ignavibacteriales bacterium]
MKEFRFIHTADWHGDSDPIKQRKLEASLGQMVDYCQVNKVNAIIISGDVWEKKQSYADNSGVPMVITYLRHLSRLVDFIFIVKGNNSHDEPGSISLLHQMESNIYAYESPTILGIIGNNTVVDLVKPSAEVEPDYIISLFPYPTKAALLNVNSIDGSNEDYIQVLESILRMIGNVHIKYNVPKIFGFHGNVQGTRLSSGQTLLSQDIIVSPFTLQLAMADYYALGHIHLAQKVFYHGYYSGSIYNKNWGETEQKSFNVIKFVELHADDDREENQFDEEITDSGEYFIFINKVPLTAARPMISISGTFNEGKVDSTQELSADEIDAIVQGNAEVRLKIKVNENDRKLITATTEEELKKQFGEDVKIEWDVVPVERESRSEQIMSCRSYVDEVVEYAAVIGEEVPDSVKVKVEEIQQEAGL